MTFNHAGTLQCRSEAAARPGRRDAGSELTRHRPARGSGRGKRRGSVDRRQL